MRAPKREPRLSHDRRILLMAFASALPGAAISLVFLWTGDYTPKVQWTLTVLIITFCLGFAFALRSPLGERAQAHALAHRPDGHARLPRFGPVCRAGAGGGG